MTYRYVWRVCAPWINLLCAAFLLGLAINDVLSPNPRILIIVLDIIATGFNIFAAWNWWRN
jgi:hypothetical protein